MFAEAHEQVHDIVAEVKAEGDAAARQAGSGQSAVN
jgi:hypothetical protein